MDGADSLYGDVDDGEADENGADDAEGIAVAEERPAMTREEMRRFQEQQQRQQGQQLLAAGQRDEPPPGNYTPLIPTARPGWLQPTSEPDIFAGEEGIELPGDGGDAIPPIGSGGAVLKTPVKDFDAWMAKLEPLFLEYPGLYKLQVYRKSPTTTPEGVYCEGVCGEFNQIITTGFIQQRFGGHKYDIRLQGPARNSRGEVVNKMAFLATFHGLKVAGVPRVDTEELASAGFLKSGPEDTRTAPERRRAHAIEQAREQAKAAEEARKPPPPAPAPPPPTLEAKLASQLVQASLERTERLEQEAKNMREQLVQQGGQPVVAPRDDSTARLLMQQNSSLQQTLIDLLRDRPEATAAPAAPPDNTKDALLVEAFRALASARNAPSMAAPVAPPDKEELERLHRQIEALQGDLRKLNEDRRHEIDELTRRFRDEADTLRKDHARTLDDVRVKHRDELSDMRSETRAQAESQIGLVRQQYESLLTTVRNADEERLRILQAQLDDYRNQTTEARGKLSAAEANAQQARLEEIAAKTRAEIAAVTASSRPKGEDGLSGVVKTVREMRDAMEIISPGSSGAAPVEVAKPGVTDRVLGIAETIAKSEKGAEILKVILDRWERRSQQPAQQPAQQQPQQPAQPTSQQMDEAQRAWAVELEKQRQTEQARREAARAQQQPPRYTVSDGVRFETLEDDAAEAAELPRQQPAPAPAPPPAEPSEQDIAAAMMPTVESTLAAIEQAALEDMPPEQCVDAILKSTMGMTREEALGLFAGIDPRTALAEIGITKEQLSMAGGAYFDRVVAHISAALPPA